MIDDDTLECWTINYGLNRDPNSLYAIWERGAPFGAVLALRAAVEEIKRLRAEAEKE
jgi:hypothetical protein